MERYTERYKWEQDIVFKQGLFKSLRRSQHGLSQQGVWLPFWTPKPLNKTPQDTQIF